MPCLPPLTARPPPAPCVLGPAPTASPCTMATLRVFSDQKPVPIIPTNMICGGGGGGGGGGSKWQSTCRNGAQRGRCRCAALRAHAAAAGGVLPTGAPWCLTLTGAQTRATRQFHGSTLTSPAEQQASTCGEGGMQQQSVTVCDTVTCDTQALDERSPARQHGSPSRCRHCTHQRCTQRALEEEQRVGGLESE